VKPRQWSRIVALATTLSRSLFALKASRCIAGLLSIAIGIATFASAPAGATLPPFSGGTSFPAIHGPLDPEEFSWEVQLDADQGLKLIDPQHAEVFFEEGGHTAFTIEAAKAHDVEGTAVPTNLAVTDPNVLTLTVHHHAGNPAAGGAPFVYPVIAGAGWEGGLTTIVVTLPPGEFPPTEDPPLCVVPKLKGMTLKASKRRLRKAACDIGRVNRLKGADGRKGRVLSQRPKAGAVLPATSSVAVTVGPVDLLGHMPRNSTAPGRRSVVSAPPGGVAPERNVERRKEQHGHP
jgi:hypothetical protein